MGRRGRDLAKKSILSVATIGRGLTMELLCEGFLPHIRHPNPWDLHWRDEPPKHLALKTNRT